MKEENTCMRNQATTKNENGEKRECFETQGFSFMPSLFNFISERVLIAVSAHFQAKKVRNWRLFFDVLSNSQKK